MMRSAVTNAASAVVCAVDVHKPRLALCAWFAVLVTGCASSLPRVPALTPSPAPAAPTADAAAPRYLSSFEVPAPNEGAAPARRETSDAIGLTYDDTIFTQSARTRNFTGQGLIPRTTYVRATHLYDGNDRQRDASDTELTAFVTTVKAIVGLHEDVTLSATLPYFRRELKTTQAGRRLRLNADGFGDVAVVGKWRFWKAPELRGTTEIAGFFGIELPTGSDSIRDAGMRLPQPLQPGSGSVDGILGAAFTRVWDGGRWLVNADAFYKRNAQANDYRFGDVARFDVGGQFRVYPEQYERYDQLTLNLIVELNGRYAGKDQLDGHRIDGTGGLKLFVSPGIQAIVTENLLFELGVQLPAYRNVQGPQLVEDVRATIGLRWLF